MIISNRRQLSCNVCLRSWKISIAINNTPAFAAVSNIRTAANNFINSEMLAINIIRHYSHSMEKMALYLNQNTHLLN